MRGAIFVILRSNHLEKIVVKPQIVRQLRVKLGAQQAARGRGNGRAVRQADEHLCGRASTRRGARMKMAGKGLALQFPFCAFSNWAKAAVRPIRENFSTRGLFEAPSWKVTVME